MEYSGICSIISRINASLCCGTRISNLTHSISFEDIRYRLVGYHVRSLEIGLVDKSTDLIRLRTEIADIWVFYRKSTLDDQQDALCFT